MIRFLRSMFWSMILSAMSFAVRSRTARGKASCARSTSTMPITACQGRCGCLEVTFIPRAMPTMIPRRKIQGGDGALVRMTTGTGAEIRYTYDGLRRWHAARFLPEALRCSAQHMPTGPFVQTKVPHRYNSAMSA